MSFLFLNHCYRCVKLGHRLIGCGSTLTLKMPKQGIRSSGFQHCADFSAAFQQHQGHVISVRCDFCSQTTNVQTVCTDARSVITGKAEKTEKSALFASCLILRRFAARRCFFSGLDLSKGVKKKKDLSPHQKQRRGKSISET